VRFLRGALTSRHPWQLLRDRAGVIARTIKLRAGRKILHPSAKLLSDPAARLARTLGLVKFRACRSLAHKSFCSRERTGLHPIPPSPKNTLFLGEDG
jgi:hypothetical protein